jgi:hypothetical protein
MARRFEHHLWTDERAPISLSGTNSSPTFLSRNGQGWRRSKTVIGLSAAAKARRYRQLAAEAEQRSKSSLIPTDQRTYANLAEQLRECAEEIIRDHIRGQ